MRLASVSRFASTGRRCRLLLVLAAGFFCAPAFAAGNDCVSTRLPAEATRSPGPSQRFQCARLLAERGDYAAALQEYRALSDRYPDNVDYLFGEAQVRFWSGDLAGALRLLPRARRLAPEYEAVWRLEYQVLNASGYPEAVERREALRSAARQRFPAADWLQDEPVAPAARLHWEAGMNVDSLDNGAPDWRHVYARLDRRSPAGTIVSLMLSEHRRFGLADPELAVAGSFEPSDNWIVDGGVRFSPDAEFLAETTAELGVARVLDRGWTVGAGARQRRYADDTVDSFGLEVQRYFGPFRASWQLQNTRLGSASSFVQIAALDYFPDSGSRYGLTVAAGEEVEIAAPGSLREMDITAVALSGSHPLGERLAVLWRVGTHRQDSLYRRNTVGLSIAGSF